MIKKASYLIPADRCGVWWVKTIHLYLGWNRKTAYLNNFIKVSVKSVKSKNKLKRKMKPAGVIIRVRKENFKNDGSSFKFNQNNLVLLKKRMTPRGKELFGPVTWVNKKKKFRASFAGIL